MAPEHVIGGSTSGGLPLELIGRAPQCLVHLHRCVATHLLSEPGGADVGRGYRNGRRGRAAERPFDPCEQLIDLPAVVASHDNVKAVHSLTSTRLQAARPPG